MSNIKTGKIGKITEKVINLLNMSINPDIPTLQRKFKSPLERVDFWRKSCLPLNTLSYLTRYAAATTIQKNIQVCCSKA